MPCSAKLTKLLVAILLLVVKTSEETGSSPMELEFPVQVSSGIFTEPEVIWWYVCNAEEVEQKGSIDVRYLIHLVLSRPYTLECTQQTLVSGSLVSSPRVPPGEKRSGEQSRIPWAYSPKRWKTNEIARSLIIM